MSLLKPHIHAMQGYVPGEQPPPGARLIKLNTNENPYPPSPAVLDAIRRELATDGALLRRYSDPAATVFREAAAELAGLSPAHVMCGNGSDELLAILFRATVGTGDTVAYPYPTYVLYQTLAQAQGARVLSFDFDPGFALPAGLFGCEAQLVLIASPNSPSGTLFPPEELEGLARSLPSSVLVVDEAYVQFGDGRSALPLVDRLSNVVVVRTLSKSHSLAGMRLGLLFAAPSIVRELWKIKDSYNLDRLAIEAGAAALRDQGWAEANLARVRTTRARLSSGLAALGLEVLPSEANFVFARFGSAARAEAAFAGLRQRGVLVRYFRERLLDDGLRITVGTDDEIEALLRALAAHLRETA